MNNPHHQESSSNGTLIKIAVGVITTLLTASTIAIAANLVQLNREMIGLQAWRNQLDASDSALRNSLPRNEWVLQRQLIEVELEQLRARLNAMENRRQP